MPNRLPRVVYLDQNKWIALAQAAKNPREHPEARVALELVCKELEAKKIVLPLTSTNVYETHKINDARRRFELAYCQVTLSRAFVFRGRYKRLTNELTDFLRRAHGLPPISREGHWFLSTVFYESSAEWDDPRLGAAVSRPLFASVRQDPQTSLFRFWTEGPEDHRMEAVRNFTKGSRALIESIETRRNSHATESLAMRRRIHSALLLMNDLETVQHTIVESGIPEASLHQVLPKYARRIVEECPTFRIEREIALRIESQKDRPLHENDLRDMQSFVAAIAYADIVVAENQFANLAKQSGLERQYDTVVTTKMSDLIRFLEGD